MSVTKTKRLQAGALALLVLAAVLALILAAELRGPATGAMVPHRGHPMPALFSWPVVDAAVWNRCRSGAPVAPPIAGALAARFRLAGVFLVLSDPDNLGPETRCAILDDLQTQQQVLAAEGESAGSVQVLRVAGDYVVLSDGEREETIFLAAGSLPGQDKAGIAPGSGAEAPKILETNRFGNRIGETRWEFNRQAILDYYQEMMDNPERLAALFMAMEPDRDEEGRVAGYRLNMDVGEKDFYTAVGLQNGDVVRKVNSMRMTSQRRAEYFIGEFVQNRLGAVVIDVERNGEPKKLVYLVK